MAFSWTSRAAEQNLGLAQLRLAVIYWDGKAAPQNTDRAYFWFVLGTLAADGEYSPLVESLRAELTPLFSDLHRSTLEAQALHWLSSQAFP